MLLRLAYLTATNVFAVLRRLPMSDQAKDTEILALRHQITVRQRDLSHVCGLSLMRFSVFQYRREPPRAKDGGGSGVRQGPTRQHPGPVLPEPS
ncbi:hypothetical protein ACWERW_19965 [Streptomyces sp. NPDC004012]